MYICVFRVNKLADSETEIQATQSSLSISQREQNKNKSRSMFRNYEGSVIPRLNEIANIKFNTGVSIFTKR